MKKNPNKPSKAFWIIAVIGFIWSAMGVHGYLNQAYQTERFKLMYSEEQLDLIYNTPSWVMAAFAIAVFSSVFACVFLFFKKKLAKTFFLIGLIAVLLQSTYNAFLNPGKELYGSMDYTMLIMIPLFSVFLFWFSKKCADDGILT
ncbi:hypothetical protein MPF19_17715 [Polaribacter sp. Z014]|uniref:hypothetical protein n=1 Tax=unclassified Polaribacter TaxID=196858 RepID=UPI00193C0A5F|nr:MULTISPECIES: hypothetical protein [unclassified Polaribacter]MCL7765263.1 hypothetical protein [Polaribacter sp. Z014]QVY65918.1 hypothetical protein JOP69_01090 [Polaribacter sp. Q13]